MILGALAAAQVILAGAMAVLGVWWSVLCALALAPVRVRRFPIPGAVAVLVPAHNEEALVARTIHSLHRATAAGAATVFVIADNCTDTTAAVARGAGATVLERSDPLNRGKSFALDFGLEHLRAQPNPPMAVAVVDADTEVSADFFAATAARIAGGSLIVQAHYAAARSDAPVARLRRLAFSLIHWSRPLGASRLGLPTTLKGNGMVFAWEVISKGFPGGGITEDAAATLEFAKRGLTVDFEPRAIVWGLMAANYEEAATQDRRWEGGRLSLAPRAGIQALDSLSRLRPRAASAQLELASPPLTLALMTSAAACLSGAAGFGSLKLGIFSMASLGLYVMLGLAAARPAPSDLAALVHVPRFLFHKASSYVGLVKGRPRNWERTVR
jgi:cellulose synthase/poly-beta-1,6-N-acetylglucosamine synthase-like glycosyltransferase